jgi:hypothetical protein
MSVGVCQSESVNQRKLTVAFSIDDGIVGRIRCLPDWSVSGHDDEKRARLTA